ncbi:protein of unknown function [Magnetospirillum sp. XM-1]|nr:protein of unknown function [Magnetospirillum sp. XM-1]
MRMFRFPFPFKRHAEIAGSFEIGEKYRFAKALDRAPLDYPLESWALFPPFACFLGDCLIHCPACTRQPGVAEQFS